MYSIAIATAFILLSAQTNIFLNESQFSGYIPTTDSKNQLFYWLFKSRDLNQSAPLLLWFTGGPGCSSMGALFTENGPFTVADNLTLILNPYSWNSKADLMFIDQPIGTGFSTGSNYSYTGNDYASNVYLFLINFMNAHTEYQGRDLYITGESYAGHYIPMIGYYILKHPHKYLKLHSVAIGNGWISPSLQYPYYAKFAYENKLISRPMYNIVKTLLEAGSALVKEIIFPFGFVISELSKMLITGFTLKPRFNFYDIRIKCEHPPLCYKFDAVQQFLNTKETQQELGVTKVWEECSAKVMLLLLIDNGKDYSQYIGYLVDNDVNVMIYNGDQDFMCNWMGGEAVANAVRWQSTKEFVNSGYEFKVMADGHAYAQAKSYGRLSFWRVFDAGHMVPMDQPAFSKAMIEAFLGYNSFI